jgi:hypothetical protein
MGCITGFDLTTLASKQNPAYLSRGLEDPSDPGCISPFWVSPRNLNLNPNPAPPFPNQIKIRIKIKKENPKK